MHRAASAFPTTRLVPRLAKRTGLMQDFSTKTRNNFVIYSTNLSSSVQAETGRTRHCKKVACRRCGAIDTHEQHPGTCVHWRRLACRHCGAFIKWLPRPRSAAEQSERAAKTHQNSKVHLASKPPTEKQIRFLRALGHLGPAPEHRLEASELIGSLLRRSN